MPKPDRNHFVVVVVVPPPQAGADVGDVTPAVAVAAADVAGQLSHVRGHPKEDKPMRHPASEQ